MIRSSMRWIHPVRRAAFGAALALSATGPALAVPVDAVPLERPAMAATAVPDMGGDEMPAAASPTPYLLPQVQERADAPKLGAPALQPAEPAILRLAFAPDEATLNAQAIGQIRSFAEAFKRHGGRVTLKAYAGAIGDVSTNARRLSLKRVLAVRETLLAQGIAAERLNVQALGGARDAGPPDRVDIVRMGG